MRRLRERRDERRMSTALDFRPKTALILDCTNLQQHGMAGSDATFRPRAKSSHGLESSISHPLPWDRVLESTFWEEDQDQWAAKLNQISLKPRPEQHHKSPSWSALGEAKGGIRSIVRKASISVKSALFSPAGKGRALSVSDNVSGPASQAWTESSVSRKRSSIFRRSRIGNLYHNQSSLSISLPLSDASTKTAASIHPSSIGLAPGAAARAAVAAQNERMSTHFSRVGDLPLPGCPYGVKRDSESGISLSSEYGNRVDSKNDLGVLMLGIDPVSYLPPELMEEVLSLLDATHLKEAELVSKAWNSLATSSHVWRQVFLRRFEPKTSTESLPLANGGKGLGNIKGANQEWKKMYAARLKLNEQWRHGRGVAAYLDGHIDGVYCVQYDEDKIITGSRDRTIRVWDMHTFQCIKVIGIPQAYDNDVQRRKATTESLTIHTSTIFSGRDLPLNPNIYHTPAYHHNASILCLQYDDEIVVTGSSDRTLIVWDLATWQPLHHLIRHSQGVLDNAFDKDKIISCSKDYTICIWDRHTGYLLQQLSGHEGPVNAVQLRGNLLVSASGDGVARLWNLDLPAGQARCVKEFSRQARGLACVEFSEDAKFLIAGGNDQVIYKFCTTTGALVTTMPGHTHLVRSLYLDVANSRIVSGSYDMSLKVWDFASGTQLNEGFDEWTTSWMLSAKCDYRRIVATSQDGRALIIDFGRSPDGTLLDGMDLLQGREASRHTNLVAANSSSATVKARAIDSPLKTDTPCAELESLRAVSSADGSYTTDAAAQASSHTSKM